jgi:hypothetical protein
MSSESSLAELSSAISHQFNTNETMAAVAAASTVDPLANLAGSALPSVAISAMAKGYFVPNLLYRTG